MMKNVSIGQEVLFFGDPVQDEKKVWRPTILHGTVTDIKQEIVGANPLRVSTTVILECPKLPERFVQRPIRKIYANTSEIRREIQRANGELDERQIMRDEIKSVKDLLVFIFTHDMEMREGNPEREVAYEKAQELLGFDLNAVIGAIEV